MKKIVFGLAIVGGAVGIAFYTGILRLNYPSTKTFPIQGVDVSHHQGRIDWRAAQPQIQFAYIKATEGTDFKDPAFVVNWIGCKYADVPRGAYHFFNFHRSGAEQAKNFLDTVPLEPDTLPPALDLEFSGNPGPLPSQAAMQREIFAFVAGISTRFPEPPVFYVTPEFYKRYMAAPTAHFPAYRLWIRSTIGQPTLSTGKDWIFWQYTGRGHRPGLHGFVDLNAFQGSAEQFETFKQTAFKGRIDRPAMWKS